MDMKSGIVFDIQRYSVQDGPGIRSTVFFKGCPLSCAWCSNPESQQTLAQILFFEHLCHQCGACVSVCPQHCLSLPQGQGGGQLCWQRADCTACGACVAVCPQKARILSGTRMSVAEVCEQVRQDWRIYMQSGGGVTCGGGEALAQPHFLHALLTALHDDLGFHTCLDTSGYASWQTLESMVPVLDRVLLDIKHMDSATHARYTGVGNELILSNARCLALRGMPMTIRLPLIPGCNDQPDNVRALGAFMEKTGLTDLEIMPYHTLGRSKYAALGRAYPMPEAAPSALEALRELLEEFPVNVIVHQ